MRSALVATILLLAGLVSSAWASPPDRQAPEVRGPQALLQITTEDGVCYWDVSADDGLVRLPLKDSSLSAVLLSASFEGEELIVTLAEERQPLETVSLGRYALALGESNSVPVAVPGSPGKIRTLPWELRVVPGPARVAAGCCGCSIEKISCCPRTGHCLTCGTCGECCN